MKYVITGAIALVLLLLVRKMFAKPAAASGGGSTGRVVPPTEADIRESLQGIASTFGVDIARNVERIYRLETRGFDSGQFRATNTAGMEATKDTFPFGWSPRGTTPDYFAPLVTMPENATGVPTKFVAFIYFNDAARYLAQFLQDYGNNAGRWKSTEPALQAAYRQALAAIPTPFVDSAPQPVAANVQVNIPVIDRFPAHRTT